MMRSLFSGVAGLKTHQTRMDVIGNNIANVNTTAYKSQTMVFQDLMYQTTQKASGYNATTGLAGVNARREQAARLVRRRVPPRPRAIPLTLRSREMRSLSSATETITFSQGTVPFM